MPKQTSVSEDARNAERLADQERIAERLRALLQNDYQPMVSAYAGPFNRHLDWPTLCLAVIGAIVVGLASVAIMVPVLMQSIKFWGL